MLLTTLMPDVDDDNAHDDEADVDDDDADDDVDGGC